MKNIISILFVIIAGLQFSACDKQDCSQNGTDYDVLSGKNVITTVDTIDGQAQFHYDIIDGGNKTLAKYSFGSGYCNDWYDDEFGETFTFELNEEVDNYTLTDNEIQEANGYYFQFGAWVSSNWHYPITKGTVVVEKLNDRKWSIEFNIVTPDLFLSQEPRIVQGEGVFKK